MDANATRIQIGLQLLKSTGINCGTDAHPQQN